MAAAANWPFLWVRPPNWKSRSVKKWEEEVQEAEEEEESETQKNKWLSPPLNARRWGVATGLLVIFIWHFTENIQSNLNKLCWNYWHVPLDHFKTRIVIFDLSTLSKISKINKELCWKYHQISPNNIKVDKWN